MNIDNKLYTEEETNYMLLTSMLYIMLNNYTDDQINNLNVEQITEIIKLNFNLITKLNDTSHALYSNLIGELD